MGISISSPPVSTTGLALDGSNSPTAEISWDGQNLVDVGDFQQGQIVTTALNARSVIAAKTTTTDATLTNAASVTLVDNSVELIEVFILARKTDGTDRAGYKIQGVFYRQGGGAVQLGTTKIDLEEESEISYDVDFAVSGNDVKVQVTGVAATSIDWFPITQRKDVFI